MNKILYIVLISLFSLTVISCAKKDEPTSSSSSSGTTTKSYVSVGNSGTILTSSDGTSWDNRTSGTKDLKGVNYGNSIFVVAGVSGTILTSSDGTTWTSRTSGTTNTLWGVTYSQ